MKNFWDGFEKSANENKGYDEITPILGNALLGGLVGGTGLTLAHGAGAISRRNATKAIPAGALLGMLAAGGASLWNKHKKEESSK